MGHPPKMSTIAIFLEKSFFALICALIFIFIFLKNGTKNGWKNGRKIHHEQYY